MTGKMVNCIFYSLIESQNEGKNGAVTIHNKFACLTRRLVLNSYVKPFFELLQVPNFTEYQIYVIY